METDISDVYGCPTDIIIKCATLQITQWLIDQNLMWQE
jgi:hypothetical protein